MKQAVRMSNMSVTEVFRDGYPVRAGLLMAMVWLLAACATPGGAGRAPAEPAGEPVPEEVVAAPAPEPEVVQEQPLTADLMFDILLGEIAGQRGRLDVATPHYLQAALESDDPQSAGLDIAARLVRESADICQGVHLMTGGQPDLARRIIEMSDLS